MIGLVLYGFAILSLVVACPHLRIRAAAAAGGASPHAACNRLHDAVHDLG